MDRGIIGPDASHLPALNLQGTALYLSTSCMERLKSNLAHRAANEAIGLVSGCATASATRLIATMITPCITLSPANWSGSQF